MNAPRALSAALFLLAACSTNGGGGTQNTPPPVINSFTADASTVSPGQSTTLRWSLTNATSISIDHGVGAVTGNSVVVQPIDTTTYLLTATNAGGTATSSITVTVRARAPAIASFAGSPATIGIGSSSTLSWSVSNATSLTIDHGVGAVAGTSTVVTPSVTTTYTLTATGLGGTVTATTTVTVIPAPVISSFKGSPASVAVGVSSTLSWTVSNATSLSIDQGVGLVTGLTSVSVSPRVDTTYVLTATGLGGVTTSSTTVTVHAASLHVQYDDPAAGGKLRLVRNAASTATHLVLDLQVGSNALSGFGIALTLPMDPAMVTFVPATGLVLNASVLDAGSSPATAAAAVPSAGPLQNMLVVGVARKKQAATDGDVTLSAGATVFSIVVDLNGSAPGQIFSGSNLGTAARAALLNKAGAEVVSIADFAIGDLSLAL
ncbi:MAG: hypothetical protein E6J58_02295 [Deltaproteobacteria bacterium]|nr:MAG: hypothetical protein E6J58_02295 [Deltaproteobacteria bacterium]